MQDQDGTLHLADPNAIIADEAGRPGNAKGEALFNLGLGLFLLGSLTAQLMLKIVQSKVDWILS